MMSSGPESSQWYLAVWVLLGICMVICMDFCFLFCSSLSLQPLQVYSLLGESDLTWTVLWESWQLQFLESCPWELVQASSLEMGSELVTRMISFVQLQQLSVMSFASSMLGRRTCWLVTAWVSSEQWTCWLETDRGCTWGSQWVSRVTWHEKTTDQLNQTQNLGWWRRESYSPISYVHRCTCRNSWNSGKSSLNRAIYHATESESILDEKVKWLTDKNISLVWSVFSLVNSSKLKVSFPCLE